jgi:membrane associated rhomboid family serine protease
MNSYRSNGFSSMPPVVKNLIIINVIFLALQFTLERMQIDLSQYLGLHYWRSDYFKPWQLLTHMFMHGNFMHLLSNMFALWMFGSVLENLEELSFEYGDERYRPSVLLKQMVRENRRFFN